MSEPDGADGRTRTSRLRPVVAGAAAVVLVVAAAVLAVRAAGGDDAGGRATGPTAPQVVAPPPGQQLVSSLGLQLAVPQEWEVSGPIGGCETLPDAVVVRGGGPVAGCGYQEPVDFTLVEIGRPALLEEDLSAGYSPGGPPAPGATPATSRPGPDLEQTRVALADGRVQLLVTAPERDVAVLLRGPDEQVLQDVVATIRFVDVDAAGCPSILRRTPWDRPGRQGVPAVAVGAAARVSVCAYSALDDTGQRLAASTLLSGAAAREVVDALDAAPAGRLPAPAGASCAGGTGETSSVLLLVQGAGGTTPVRIHHSGSCTDRWVASPAGLSAPTTRLLQAVYGPLRVGWSTSGMLP